MSKPFATLLLAILLIPAISAFAQNNPGDNPAPDGPPPGQDNGGPGGPPDFSQMRQRMESALKHRLGVTDEEWAVLSPKIQKVRQLQNQLRPPRPDFGPRNGPPGGPPNADQNNNNQDQNPPPPPQGNSNNQSAHPSGSPDMNAQGPGGPPGPPPEIANSPVQKAVDHLNQLLRTKDSSDSDIQSACDALRQARTTAKSNLSKAQEDLKSVVTPRQEAALLAMGILE
jgi:Spy/CpxP family protein refolding chaperone